MLDREFPKTFFNSLSRRRFHTAGVAADIEFVDLHSEPTTGIVDAVDLHRYEVADGMRRVCARILADFPFANGYADIKACVGAIARSLRDRLQHSHASGLQSIELIPVPFFRERRAYLVGRAVSERGHLPVVIALVSTPQGVMADAVLTEVEQLSQLFSYARSYFHADLPTVGELAALRALPGIGPYTAAAIASIAFDRPAVVLDGNVERVMSRLHAVEAPLPGAKEELRALAALLTPAERPGDYAQAVMDLGATICAPRAPACGICPWLTPRRARRLGIAAELPRKVRKAKKPVRRGVAYLARRADGAVLVEWRPDRGLLGGMLGLPGTDWAEMAPSPRPPFAADWRDLGVEARHTFTHFHLILTVEGACVGMTATGEFRDADAALAAMPTVMRKALRLGLGALGDATAPARRANSRR